MVKVGVKHLHLDPEGEEAQAVQDPIAKAGVNPGSLALGPEAEALVNTPSLLDQGVEAQLQSMAKATVVQEVL